MQHCATEICISVHISVTKWCIVRHLSDALWDLWDEPIPCICSTLLVKTQYEHPTQQSWCSEQILHGCVIIRLSGVHALLEGIGCALSIGISCNIIQPNVAPIWDAMITLTNARYGPIHNLWCDVKTAVIVVVQRGRDRIHVYSHYVISGVIIHVLPVWYICLRGRQGQLCETSVPRLIWNSSLQLSVLWTSTIVETRGSACKIYSRLILIKITY